MHNENKTSYNKNIKHMIKIPTFATFQQPYSWSNKESYELRFVT